LLHFFAKNKELEKLHCPKYDPIPYSFPITISVKTAFSQDMTMHDHAIFNGNWAFLSSASKSSSSSQDDDMRTETVSADPLHQTCNAHSKLSTFMSNLIVTPTSTFNHKN